MGTPTGEMPTKPVAGAAYVGDVDGQSLLPVSFEVAASGKAITYVKVAHPLQCYLHKAYLPSVSSGKKSFPIEASTESFTAKVEAKIGSADSQLASDSITVTIEGQFHASKHESGKISTTQGGYVANQEFASSCNSEGTVAGTYETTAHPAHKKKGKRAKKH